MFTYENFKIFQLYFISFFVKILKKTDLFGAFEKNAPKHEF